MFLLVFYICYSLEVIAYKQILTFILWNTLYKYFIELTVFSPKVDLILECLENLEHTSGWLITL